MCERREKARNGVMDKGVNEAGKGKPVLSRIVSIKKSTKCLSAAYTQIFPLSSAAYSRRQKTVFKAFKYSWLSLSRRQISLVWSCCSGLSQGLEAVVAP